MAFRISGAAIRNPIPPLVLFAVLTLVGLISFNLLPITRAPNIDVPVVSVTVVQPGAAPAELEAQVTKKVEDAVANITGVKHVTSSVTDGTSQTIIELRLEVSTDRAVNDVRDAISKIRTDLPRNIDEPIIERIDVVGQSIMTFAATAPAMTMERLSWFVDDVVMRDLQGVKGVGRVERVGGVTREIEVKLDPDRLAALGITAGSVNRQLAATSADLSGGRGELGRQEQAIRTLGGARTLEQLAATRIVLPGGREARLSDVARIEDGFEEPRNFARMDGATPVVSFSIYRAKGASDVTVAKTVQERLAALANQYPDVVYTLIDDGVRATQGSFNSAMESLIEGAVLATIVVMIFLRNWRATLARRHCPAALGHPRLRRDADHGLLAQLREPARHHPGHRHPGRRRHRRDREHRPPHADGQAPLRGRHGGRRRDRPRGRRHHLHHHRRVRAGQLHGRHRRPVFQAVRPDRRRRRLRLAARRPPDHAADGRLPAQARPRPSRARGLDACAPTRASSPSRCASAR